MEAGDRKLERNQFKDAKADYETAVGIGRQMGPIYDKEIKALLQLIKVYDGEGKPAKAEEVREALAGLSTDGIERLPDLLDPA